MLLSTYILLILKIILPCPLPASHSHPLFCCNSPFSPIPLTHLLRKQFPTPISILIHLPSKLFIHILFALVNTPFNLSFFFIDLHTSVHCNLISSLPPNTSFHVVSFLSTVVFTTLFPTSIHILVHLPSKLFPNLLLILIYTPFNLYFFCLVNFQTSPFFIFISSSQHFLPGLIVVWTLMYQCLYGCIDEGGENGDGEERD